MEYVIIIAFPLQQWGTNVPQQYFIRTVLPSTSSVAERCVL